MKTRLVDANLIIRFLTNDSPEQAQQVEKLFENQNQKLEISDVTFAEIIWVLTSYYRFSKPKIISSLKTLLDLRNIKSNKKLLVQSLDIYGSFSVDYIDAYLASLSSSKMQEIYSFDQDLDKINNIKRLKPN